MRHLARLGCAALALLVIAGLTSIGLYSIVVGGLLNNVPVARSVVAGAPVLVTIQAGSATATPATASSDIPTPGPGNPSKPGPALATPAAAPVPAPGTSGSGTGTGSPSVAGASAGSGTSAAGSGSTGTGATAGSPPTAPGASAPGAQPAGGDPPSAGRGASGSNAPPAAAPGAQPAANRRVTHEGLAAEIVDVEHGWSPTNIDGTSIGVQAGLDIVTVLLQLTNTSGDLRYVADSDILLVGSDGTRYAPRPTPLAREPHLLTMPILPGDVVKGWQTYAVPQGVTITRAQWNPSRADRTSAGAAYNLDLPR